VVSWHTNVHEFAARRVGCITRWLGRRTSEFAAAKTESFVLDRLRWFLGSGTVIFAPNPELASMLRASSGKPVSAMGRGIDTNLFRPERRQREDQALVLGYVGRLMPEKNLRLLPRVAATLRAGGITNFCFQISGSGSERPWLERNLAFSVHRRAPRPGLGRSIR
jgi:phosphatidylinositol alpha 1,6-mannosyltransferase